jgi:autotransporter-associated beta strand protein
MEQLRPRFSLSLRALPFLLRISSAAIVVALWTLPAQAQRVKGLDTSSSAVGSSGPSQELWDTAYSQGYQFAFLRSSRGGTVEGSLTDAAFYNNITRATTAGMLAGSYHYTRPDLTGHTGANEAVHYMNIAGNYMKPGYLLPVVDMEAQFAGMTPTQLTNFILDMVTTIEAEKGITPIVYSNTSYANDEVLKSLAFTGSTPRTYHWLARPGSNGLTGDPPAPGSFPNPYGVWDPNFVSRTNSRDPAINPWVFWQQTLNTTPAGLFLIDIDYANGNIEFVKDFLVPALWTADGDDDDWGTIENWNSDNPAYNGTIQSGPAPRLPNNQSLDWVKLQNPSGGTVTISSGAQTVRKFYTEQALNISGGSLSVGYVPGSGGKWDLPSEFKAVVTMSSGGAYTAHTTQVDGGGGSFNINGGNITFTDIQLASHASNSGKIIMGGDAVFDQTGGNVTAVIRSTGSLAQPGNVTLSEGNRTFTVTNGSANVDLNVRAAVTGTGRLVLGGSGTMQLSADNSYTGGTTLNSGVLQVSADNRLGDISGPQSDNIILNGGTLRTGAQIDSVSLTNAGSGYTSFPTLTIGGAGANVHPASANVLAGISSIAITNGGSGYVNQNPAVPPAQNTAGTFVDIVGGGGTGATAYATVVGGVVTNITIDNPGTGYTSMPTIHISSTVVGSLAGTGATANVSGITLQGIALNDGGFDYTNPTISLTGGGGSGAAASATSSPNQTLHSDRGISLTSNGGTLNQTAGTTLNIAGPISSSGSGDLSKMGLGTLVLSGANTYSGNTTISAGLLTVSGDAASLGLSNVTVQGTTAGTALVIESGVDNAIDDAATLNLFGGGAAGVADQGYANLGEDITEIVGTLLLNGVAQPNGTYGSSLSAATFKLDEYFTGTGILQVGATPAILAGDYNDDGVVDAADYVAWRKNVGQPAGTLPNDPTGLPIGDDQYNTWTSNFGATPSGSGGAVPEPSALALAAIGLLVASLRRRRH